MEKKETWIEMNCPMLNLHRHEQPRIHKIELDFFPLTCSFLIV